MRSNGEFRSQFRPAFQLSPYAKGPPQLPQDSPAADLGPPLFRERETPPTVLDGRSIAVRTSCERPGHAGALDKNHFCLPSQGGTP
jgi:hypothetical protein